MKSTKRIIAMAASVAMLSAVCAGTSCDFGVGDVQSVAAADDCHDDWLHAEGNQLYDMDGNAVWLTGCNWFGFNVGSQVFDGVWSINMHDAIKGIADHGFNFLRVPVSTQILLQWMNDEPDPAEPKVNIYSNPELTGFNSKQLFNQAVEWCKESGIKIMIDIHSAETHAAGHNFALWYNDKYSTEDLYTALEWFADYYKDDDTVLAIDVKNEPHGTANTPNDMAIWNDDYSDPRNWKAVAETAASRILAKNPNLLIMIEGIEVYPKEDSTWESLHVDYTTMYYYYYGTWWGGNFRGAKDYPIDLGKYQSQLVYSPHDYGPLVYDQTWFHDGEFTFDSLMDECWRDNWFFIYENNMAPLLIGEWGGFMDDGPNQHWMECIRDLIKQNHLNHTFWCYNENSGDTGGLVYDNFGKWDLDKYALVKPSLWQTDDGVFVSLDHQKGLGENGISVSKYYADGNNLIGSSGATTTPATTTTTPVTTTTTTPVTTTPAPVTTTTAKVTTTAPVSQTTSATVISPAKLYGDLDGNGVVEMTDLTLLSQYLIHDITLTEDQLLYADVTGDSDVDISDMSHLKQYIMLEKIILGPQK
ncbi:MAG: cellulase family glycosylhydrolase [Oscillospiraceae bacterium]|nr:cellulase family glycosylhydrolase [Oscillospiraceae bacterium]